ncbi:signal peptidase II [Acidiferrobacter thiooxydans]|jgi:signal peptidase II|uniref:Lipoprotein signal peptidase n=1 Tax=Acidiferrobacter thiooxydans TaxID=163359 RepID=A0A1C2FZJ4_9GAMM|nr:signal peptidase II [Acidiferrobacter thiooxydans]RCN56384.1 signal peptidase II [Acidiferrobacter thiooxydans]UEN99005.1 signal peptidase II [Acidiferrobacter thiooxydans]
MLGYLLIAVAVFVLDQWSKAEAVRYLSRGSVHVTSFLNLVLVYNRGAAFGFLSNASGWQNVLFIAVAVAIVAGILIFLVRGGRRDRLTVVALMLVLGGAAGNLADRIRLGEVVDFIDFHIGSWHWYTFNLADSAITVGAVLLAIDAWVSRRATTAPERR